MGTLSTVQQYIASRGVYMCKIVHGRTPLFQNFKSYPLNVVGRKCFKTAIKKSLGIPSSALCFLLSSAGVLNSDRSDLICSLFLLLWEPESAWVYHLSADMCVCAGVCVHDESEMMVMEGLVRRCLIWRCSLMESDCFLTSFIIVCWYKHGLRKWASAFSSSASICMRGEAPFYA